MVLRLHLFEFGDQQWFPQVLRDAETAYLTAAYRIYPALARQWAEKISTVLHPNAAVEIVDLCAGSGGPMPQIIGYLRQRSYDVRAILTDLYPNPNSGLDSRITWLLDPVDAVHVPPKLTGVRTMFSAFHHFRPDAARRFAPPAVHLPGPAAPALPALGRHGLNAAHLFPRPNAATYGGPPSADYQWEPGYIKVCGIPDRLPYLIGRPIC